VDVGGSHEKVMTDTGRTKREFPSGPRLFAKATVKKVQKLTKDWTSGSDIQIRASELSEKDPGRARFSQ
jgi:hypothetical protein